MEIVLYDEENGYYGGRVPRTIGRKGDFFTSVSVGEMYGLALASRAKRFKRDREPLVIVEQGAHDGQLALDVVAGLRELGVREVDYRIIEPIADRRDWLRERFAEAEVSATISVVASVEEARAPRGLFLCNELLDAFPFRRLRFDGSGWEELQVGLEKTGEHGRLGWVSRELPTELARYAEELGSEFEAGYSTEVCPQVEEWVVEVSTLFDQGEWWVVDYGYEASEYFAPHRKEGTYRCFHQHEATEDPFVVLGETDITAHANFSHLRRAAESNGLLWEELTDQHHFLIDSLKDWLLSQDGKAPDAKQLKRLRQFQTLTHPGMMGTHFKVAVLRKACCLR